MDNKTNGGPAFPSIGEGWGNPLYHSEGMTLRDYFAAAALTGIIAQTDRAMNVSIFAKEAYSLADAMIAERAK